MCPADSHQMNSTQSRVIGKVICVYSDTDNVQGCCLHGQQEEVKEAWKPSSWLQWPEKMIRAFTHLRDSSTNAKNGLGWPWLNTFKLLLDRERTRVPCPGLGPGVGGDLGRMTSEYVCRPWVTRGQWPIEQKEAHWRLISCCLLKFRHTDTHKHT